MAPTSECPWKAQVKEPKADGPEISPTLAPGHAGRDKELWPELPPPGSAPVTKKTLRSAKISHNKLESSTLLGTEAEGNSGSNPKITEEATLQQKNYLCGYDAENSLDYILNLPGIKPSVAQQVPQSREVFVPNDEEYVVDTDRTFSPTSGQQDIPRQTPLVMEINAATNSPSVAQQSPLTTSQELAPSDGGSSFCHSEDISRNSLSISSEYDSQNCFPYGYSAVKEDYQTAPSFNSKRQPHVRRFSDSEKLSVYHCDTLKGRNLLSAEPGVEGSHLFNNNHAIRIPSFPAQFHPSLTFLPHPPIFFNNLAVQPQQLQLFQSGPCQPIHIHQYQGQFGQVLDDPNQSFPAQTYNPSLQQMSGQVIMPPNQQLPVQSFKSSDNQRSGQVYNHPNRQQWPRNNNSSNHHRPKKKMSQTFPSGSMPLPPVPPTSPASSILHRLAGIKNVNDLIVAVDRYPEDLFERIITTVKEQNHLKKHADLLALTISQDRDMHNDMVDTYEKLLFVARNKEVVLLENIRQLRVQLGDQETSKEPLEWPSSETERWANVEKYKQILKNAAPTLEPGKEDQRKERANTETSPDGSIHVSAVKLNAGGTSFFHPGTDHTPFGSPLKEVSSTVTTNDGIPIGGIAPSILEHMVLALGPWIRQICPHSLMFDTECLNTKCTMIKLCNNNHNNDIRRPCDDKSCTKYHTAKTCLHEVERNGCFYSGTRARSRSPTKDFASPQKIARQHLKRYTHKEGCSEQEWKDRIIVAGLKDSHYAGVYMG